MSRRFFPFGIFILLFIVACDEKSSERDGSHSNLPYVTATIERGNIRDTIPAAGEIKPAAALEVGSEIGGRIIKVYVDHNDIVTKGQLLAEIDPLPYEAASRRAKAGLRVSSANLQEARAKLRSTKLKHARISKLISTGSVRALEIEDLDLAVAISNASVNREIANNDDAAARLSDANDNLARTKIRAPIDGIILDRRIVESQVINALQTTPVLFVVAANKSDILIEALVAENDIGRISGDLKVRFTVDAYPDFRFYGKIDKILRAPRRRGRFVSYPVLIKAEDRQGILYPGMTAAVEFIHTDARNVLFAPIKALYFMPADYTPSLSKDVLNTLGFDKLSTHSPVVRAGKIGAELGRLLREGKRLIFLLIDGKLERREVRIGAESSEFVELIDSELSEGMQIVVQEIFDE
ncbi:MAG: efflux RND transporter periplasmic adaptor subunit [Kordiimonadaceae bacterium]|nr:efflux RND transporter periplasmic adaptor subunit [Kordiimonadaceae bacterium]